MQNLVYLTYLHYIGISQRKLSSIFKNNDKYKDFYENLNTNNLKDYFNEKEINEIINKKNKIDVLKINKILLDRNVKLITIKDDNYPELLKQIHNPPFFLYIRGEIDNSPKIVVIGSRTMTSYGKKVIEKIIPLLSKYFTIVSGGAMGCDTESHIQTINNNGKTIAVIGTGIDIDYPSYNSALFNKIIEKNGCILSIFPIGEIANNYNFPIRNEIVSGISNGVVVIESGEKSGTLITANLALEQGKDVFAVPGDLYKNNSIGCNNLIKNGYAKIITSPQDILEEYNININFIEQSNNKIEFGNNLEKNIYDKLMLQEYDIDELVYCTGLNLSEVINSITMLEIKGIIKKTANGKYEIK